MPLLHPRFCSEDPKRDSEGRLLLRRKKSARVRFSCRSFSQSVVGARPTKEERGGKRACAQVPVKCGGKRLAGSGQPAGGRKRGPRCGGRREHPCGRRAPSRTGQPCSGAAARVPSADARVWARRAVERGPADISRASLHGGDPLQSQAAMGTPPAGRVPDPQGWVWPGVLGVPSQALDLFGDFRLGTLGLLHSKSLSSGGRDHCLFNSLELVVQRTKADAQESCRLSPIAI